MAETGVQVVWFKRDLRIHDNATLAAAAPLGPILPLYIVDPAAIHADDFDALHWSFIRESLVELRHALGELGALLVVRVGPATDILQALYDQVGIAGIWSHQETGNAITSQRDRAVAAWATARSIPWVEMPQTGVIRHLPNRDGWAETWESSMQSTEAQVPAALLLVPSVTPGPIPTHTELGLPLPDREDVQHGGESRGQRALATFLAARGERYYREMSSPVTAPLSCSRLSPHLAWGTISLRHVYHQAEVRRAEAQATHQVMWERSTGALLSRLHWRSHFMQKLEDEPSIEFENFNRGFDGMREQEFNQDLFIAWCNGRTGYPLVDACMRSLVATGWLNFRMRAMLTSFAAYDLWLHWRQTGLFLARQFIDYEPGIHFSQLQMQSGTTGINTLRIYDPTKQGQDHDPEGIFIRRWVPELARVPKNFIHAPWTMPLAVQQRADCRLDHDYPLPVVDHVTAVRTAKGKMAVYRKDERMRGLAHTVLERHGSRRGKQ